MRDSACSVALRHPVTNALLTQTESLDDCTIAINVAVVKIVKKRTALAYELCKAACSLVILVVLLQVFGKVLDTESEKSNLALGRACVCR